MPSDLARVVLHESAHLQRYDDWINALEQIVCALQFFQPALYVARRSIDFEREVACDDRVLEDAGEPLRYAECLARIVQRHVRGRRAAVVPGFVLRRTQVVARVRRIVDRSRDASPHLRLGAAVLGGGVHDRDARHRPPASPRRLARARRRPHHRQRRPVYRRIRTGDAGAARRTAPRRAYLAAARSRRTRAPAARARRVAAATAPIRSDFRLGRAVAGAFAVTCALRGPPGRTTIPCSRNRARPRVHRRRRAPRR